MRLYPQMVSFKILPLHCVEPTYKQSWYIELNLKPDYRLFYLHSVSIVIWFEECQCVSVTNSFDKLKNDTLLQTAFR